MAESPLVAFPSPVSVTVTNLRQVITWVARRRVRQKFFKRCMRCLACLWDGLDCRPVCCIYHKPCGFDESSDLGNKDDDSSSSSASSEGDKSGGEEDDGRARWGPPPPWRCARQKGYLKAKLTGEHLGCFAGRPVLILSQESIRHRKCYAIVLYVYPCISVICISFCGTLSDVVRRLWFASFLALLDRRRGYL